MADLSTAEFTVRRILRDGYLEAHGLDRLECHDCERPLEPGRRGWDWAPGPMGTRVPVCDPCFEVRP